MWVTFALLFLYSYSLIVVLRGSCVVFILMYIHCSAISVFHDDECEDDAVLRNCSVGLVEFDRRFRGAYCFHRCSVEGSSSLFLMARPQFLLRRGGGQVRPIFEPRFSLTGWRSSTRTCVYQGWLQGTMLFRPTVLIIGCLEASCSLSKRNRSALRDIDSDPPLP
jgi:hypothetical protein